jgi:tetratricopeptide (TPR) repeat protein
VPIYGVGCERGVHFYAMQLIDGQTLAQVIDDLRLPAADRPAAAGNRPSAAATRAVLSTEPDGGRSRPYFRAVARLGLEAAQALDHAHQVGVVHRDIKPGNLLLDAAGKLWITDFGLARIGTEAGLTMTGDLLGTLRYMSPEQVLAKRVPIDHRTDVYSLGATLYELLTLRPVVTGSDRQELLRQIAFEEPVRPRRSDPAIPAELETVVLKALEKNSADRYATAQELAEDLRRFLADAPIRARPASLIQRLRKWRRRHRAVVTTAAVGAVVTLAVLVGGVGWVLGDRAARRRTAEDELRKALKAAAPGLREGNPGDRELIAAVQQAEAHLQGDLVGRDWRRRARQLQRDVRMLAELETIRLDQTAVHGSHFDLTRSDRAYARAFREYGIGPENEAPDRAAGLVQASAIRDHLLGALHDWARCMIAADRHETKMRARRLLAIAQQVDPDRWGNRLREALLSRDASAVEELARSAPVDDLPATTLGLLGYLVEGHAAVQRASPPMVEFLRRAQRRFPADFWINQHLGATLDYAQPKQVEQVIGFRRVAVALRPQSPGARVNLGFALEKKGDLDGAIAEYRAAIRLKSDYALAHDHLGAALYQKGDLARAIAEYQKAIAFDPKDAEAHRLLGAALRAKGNPAGAIAEFRQAIALDPQDAQGHYNLGHVLYEKEDLCGAITQYRQAIALDPQNSRAHYNLGNVLFRKRDLDGAVAEYRRAIALDPKYSEAHNNLGIAHARKGDLDPAIREYRRAIALDPKNSPAHYNLGNVLCRKRDLEGAVAEYRRAIALDPKYAYAHNNLGNALRDKGDLDGAVAEYRQAIRHQNDFASAYKGLGLALGQKGDLDGAIAAYRKVVALRPKDAKAHTILGNALHNKGDLDGAIAAHRKAIALDPKYDLAHGALGQALMVQGHFAEARTAYRRCVELLSPRHWHYRSAAQQLRKCERLAVLEEKLALIQSGKQHPASAGEAVEYSELCHLKRHYAAAVRFYRRALAVRPDLVGSEANDLRYNAACAAALAGCGAGEDAAQLTEAERAGLRKQALDWLRADLATCCARLAGARGNTEPVVMKQIHQWLHDPDLNGVRGPKALAKLPTAERSEWNKFWIDVGAALARVKSRPEEKKPSPAEASGKD